MKLLLIPLEDTVVFPNMTVTLAIDVGDEERVLLVPRHEGEYANVGTVAEVVERVRLPGGGRAVDPDRPAPRRRRRGRHRPRRPPARRGRGAARRGAAARQDRASSSASTAPSSRRSSSCATPTAAIARVRALDQRARRARRHVGYSPDLTLRRRRSSCSRRVDVVERLELALRLQRERLAELQVRRRIREDVESGAQKQQREYFLRRQMDSIRKELGEDDGSVAEEYRHEDRGARAARRTCASRPSASSRGSSGWASRPASRR